MAVTQPDVLGKGYAFPFVFSGGTKASNRGVQTASGVTLVEMSLVQIMGTLVGGRIMRRKAGCQLRSIVFDPIQPEFQMIAEHVIRDAIGVQERRVVLGPISFDVSRRQQGRVDISIQYLIIKTQRAGNLVYPLFIIGSVGSPIAEGG